MNACTLINERNSFPALGSPFAASLLEICAGGFITNNEKFLFGKRATFKAWAPGLWDIVGGSSLKYEHALYTLKRETFEETGVEVIYMVTHFKGTVRNTSNEHTQLRWFTRSQLDEVPLALNEYRNLIDAWTRGIQR